MKRLILFAALLAAAPATAQQMTPTQSVGAQLGQQIGLLMAENAELRALLAAAQAKIRELEAKAAAATPTAPDTPK